MLLTRPALYKAIHRGSICHMLHHSPVSLIPTETHTHFSFCKLSGTAVAELLHVRRPSCRSINVVNTPKDETPTENDHTLCNKHTCQSACHAAQLVESYNQTVNDGVAHSNI